MLDQFERNLWLPEVMGNVILSTILAVLCVTVGVLFFRSTLAPVRSHSNDLSASVDPNQDQNDASIDEDAHGILRRTIDGANTSRGPTLDNSDLKRLRSGEYTVGIVTALSRELRAAIAVLDEKHGQPSDFCKPKTDANPYIWGRIGEHNVALVPFPMNTDGKAMAANVALSMVRTIPSIRFCLMVGIGGGVPHPQKAPDEQVRLGDVVISVPTGTTGGVVQYDLGKAEVKDGKSYFRRKGQLDHPPRSLLAVVNAFDAQRDEERLQHVIQSATANMKSKGKRFTDGSCSAYPGAANDRLFSASYIHQTSSSWFPAFDFWSTGRKHHLEMRSTDCPHCDQRHMVERLERDSPSIPRIHYGLIASGDRVIKDARTRDEIVDTLEQENVGECLCFEMEAAGLMNNFPCLVVRGISDYADSHKNDKWHNYAAVTAAAVAKELLSLVAVSKVESERRALEIVEEILQDVEEIKSHTSHLPQERIKAWLHPVDPSTNYNMAESLRHGDTNTWFLEHPAFSKWLSKRADHLWLHGPSGCGKTVLSSSIIQKLSPMCLFFYFDFRDKDKQSLEQAVKSLIFQLYCQNKRANWVVEKQWSNHDGGAKQPSRSCLIDTFDRMARQTNEVNIVLDALDECSTGITTGANPRVELLEWLQKRMAHQGSDHCRIRIIMTSRSNQTDIISKLEGVIHTNSIVGIDKESTLEDIRTLIRERLQSQEGFSRWQTPEERPYLQHIEETLIKKSNGMFRWADLQLNKLARLDSKHAMNEALRNLPEGLSDIYARSLDEVQEGHKDDAVLLLQLLLFSQRPLEVTEVLHALTVNPDGPTGKCIDIDRLMSEEMKPLSPLMSNLVKKSPYETSNGYFDKYYIRQRTLWKQNHGTYSTKPMMMLQIAHSSVRDYLTSSSANDLFQETFGRTSILRVCLAYLGTTILTIPDRSEPQKVPFFGYSLEWLYHARFPGVEEAAQEDIMRFLILNGSKLQSETSHILDARYGGFPLYVSSAMGLTWTARYLLSRGVGVNERGGASWLEETSMSPYYQELIARYITEDLRQVQGHKSVVHCVNALAAACGSGPEVVKLLLDRGADLNVECDKCGTALHVASCYGHANTVRMLIAAGADVNVKAGRYAYALQFATKADDTQVAEKIRTLLEHGAEVNAQGGRYGTALQAASYFCDYDIVKILLQHGADPNIQGGRFGNALSAAVGHEKIIRLLLEHEANPDFVEEKYRDPILKILE